MPKPPKSGSTVAGEIDIQPLRPLDVPFEPQGLQSSQDIGVLLPSRSLDQFPKFFEQLEFTEEVNKVIPEQATKQEWEIAKKRVSAITHAKKVSRKDKDIELDHSFVVVPQAQGSNPKLFALAPQGQYVSTAGVQSVIKSAYDESGHYYIVKIKSMVIKKADLENYMRQNKSPDSEAKIRKKLGQQFYEILRTSESRKMGKNELNVKDDEIVIKEYLIEDYLGQSLLDAADEVYATSFAVRIDIALQLLDQLEKLHLNNIVHCDLHPGNVLLQKTSEDKYAVSIIDFGLSRIEGEDSLQIELGKNKINVYTLDPDQMAMGLEFKKYRQLLEDKINFLKELQEVVGNQNGPTEEERMALEKASKEITALKETFLKLPKTIFLSKNADIYAAYSMMLDQLNLPVKLTAKDDYNYIKKNGIAGIRDMLLKKQKDFASLPAQASIVQRNTQGGYIQDSSELLEHLPEPNVGDKSEKSKKSRF